MDFTVDAFPDEVFHGKVIQVRKAPTTTQNVVTYETIIAVDNPEQKLFPGMTADVSILVAERDECLKNPQRRLALHPAGKRAIRADARRRNWTAGQRLVYALGKRWRANSGPSSSRAGITDGMDTEILEGLARGHRRRHLDPIVRRKNRRLRRARLRQAP